MLFCNKNKVRNYHSSERESSVKPMAHSKT